MKLKLLSMHDLNFYFLNEETEELIVFNTITQIVQYWKKDETHFTEMSSYVLKIEIFECIKSTFYSLLNEGGKGDESTI